MRLLALPLAAAVAAAAVLPFRTIVQRAPLAERPAKPAVYLATKYLDLAPFLATLRADDRPKVKAVRLSDRAVVAVFMGTRPTAGYAITVRRIAVANGRLTVTASTKEPGPDEIVVEAFTSPYHVVSVARSALGLKLPLSWRLVDEHGAVLGAGPLKR